MSHSRKFYALIVERQIQKNDENTLNLKVSACFTLKECSFTFQEKYSVGMFSFFFVSRCHDRSRNRHSSVLSRSRVFE